MKDRLLGFAQVFGLFGRCEILIFLVLRTIPDEFPLNPTYRLFLHGSRFGDRSYREGGVNWGRVTAYGVCLLLDVGRSSDWLRKVVRV